jgi:hypothetical protein
MKLSPGEKFWIGLGGYILAADMILWRRGHKSMSQEFGRWIQSPMGRKVAICFTAGLIAHLFWELPIPGQTQLKKIALVGKSPVPWEELLTRPIGS